MAMQSNYDERSAKEFWKKKKDWKTRIGKRSLLTVTYQMNGRGTDDEKEGSWTGLDWMMLRRKKTALHSCVRACLLIVRYPRTEV